MRTDVNIALIGLAGGELAKRLEALSGYIGDGAAPARMYDGKRAARCRDDDGNAICKAEQDRQPRLRADDPISTRSCPLVQLRPAFEEVVLPYLQAVVAMDLVRVQEEPAVVLRNAEGFHEKLAILLDCHLVVVHVIAQVQRSIRGFAHTACSLGEGNAQSDRIEKRLISENLQ